MNAMAYLKNVGKSMGYIAVDIYKDYHPVSSSFMSESKQFGQELYEGVKSFSASVQDAKTDPDSLLNLGKSSVKEAAINIISDLKSGKWYNKQRYDEQTNAAIAESMGFSLDGDDFDWGDNDSDFDDEDSTPEDDIDTRNTKAHMANDNRNTIANIKSMDRIAQKMSGAIGTSTFKSMQYLGEVNKHGFKEMIRVNNKGFAGVLSGLSAVNANMGALMQLGEPITQHINNSATFYTRTGEFQDKVLEKLDLIVKGVTPQEAEERNSSRRSVKDLLNADGALNLSAMKDMVTESIQDAISPITMMFGMIDPKTLAAELKSNPLGAILKGTIKAFIPTKMSNASKRIDSALGDFFGGLLTKHRNGQLATGNGLLDKLLGFVRPESAYKDSISTRNYIKGKVDWDGKSRKALMEVIPTYLAEISHALGNPYRLYDYESGKFKSRRAIISEWKAEKRGYAEINQGELIGGMRRMASNLHANRPGEMSEQQMNQFIREIGNFNETAYHSDDLGFVDLLKVYKNENESKQAYQRLGRKYGISRNTWNIMQSYLKGLESKGRLGEKNRYITTIERGRNDYGERMDMLAEEGSIYTNLFNGSMDYITPNKKTGKDVGTSKNAIKGRGNFLTNLTDRYNNNIFFYLQRLYLNSEYFAQNLPLFVSSSSYKTAIKGSKGSNTSFKGKGVARVVTVNRMPTNNAKFRPRSSIYLKMNNEEAVESKGDANDRELYEDNKNERAPVGKIKNLDNAVANAMDEDNYDEYGALMKSGLDRDIKRYYSDKMSGKKVKENKEFEKKIEAEKIRAKAAWEIEQQYKGKVNKFKDKLLPKTSQALDNVATSVESVIEDWLYNNVPLLGAMKDRLVGTKDDDGKYRGKIFSNAANVIEDSKRSIWNFIKSGRMDEEVADEDTSGAGSGLYGISAGRSKGHKGKKGKHKKTSKTTQSSDDAAADAGAEEIKEKARTIYEKKIKSGVDQITDSITSIMGRFGANQKERAKEGDVIAKVIDGAMEDAGISKGSMTTGALIGGGVSLFTGGLISPIIGAGIGAAVGLVAKSKKVQDVLFGEEKEDAATGKKERTGGLLSKDISNFIVKNAQGAAHAGRGAVIGGAAGAFFGSPIIGAIVGSTVGFVNHSETAKEKLFGKLDKNGKRDYTGLIKKEWLDNILKRKKGIGFGAVAGLASKLLLGSPFGMAGSIVLGSALGFAADTDDFKDWLLGTDINGKRQGGFVGLINDKIINPLADILQNGARQLYKDLTNTFKNFIKKHTANLLKKAFGAINGKFKITDKLKAAGKGIANFGVNMIGAPLGAARTFLQKRGLNKGYGVYDSKQGRYLDAAERELLALAFTLGIHSVSGFSSPLLIDTPLARVSGAHRVNFTNVLLEVSKNKQTILILTPDEFSQDVKDLIYEEHIQKFGIFQVDEFYSNIEEMSTNQMEKFIEELRSKKDVI